MTQLAKSLMCIQMRSGIEIWLEQDRVIQLQNILEKITGSKFINFDNQTINTADIVGIFSADTMSEHTRRKNGQWKCASGTWHDKGEKCYCASVEDKQWLDKRAEAIKNCKRGCVSGYVKTDTGMAVCECIKSL